ncbi:MAG TPA: hypothetical protein VGI10_05495 [Polyangiaceae bacterium]|jgi:pectate lyase
MTYAARFLFGPVVLLSLGACFKQSWGPQNARGDNDKAAAEDAENPCPSGTPAPEQGGPIGFAAVDALDQGYTCGGLDAEPIVVTTEEEFEKALHNATPKVVHFDTAFRGSFDIGSNTTIEGGPHASIKGHLELDGCSNVIVKNVKIVGMNCTDAPMCKNGSDAITLSSEAHHIWFDHCDISDGSDGNMDITEAADYITVSWTKFWYSSARPGGHRFANLLGNSDAALTDAGHIHVTFHHDWWADNVSERMPRVRFGQVHLFDNLYTASGDDYCVGLGVDASILTENNLFSGVKNPTNASHANSNSVLESHGDAYENITGTHDNHGTGVFKPPYPYTLDPVEGVKAAVMSGAGQH